MLIKQTRQLPPSNMMSTKGVEGEWSKAGRVSVGGTSVFSECAAGILSSHPHVLLLAGIGSLYGNFWSRTRWIARRRMKA